MIARLREAIRRARFVATLLRAAVRSHRKLGNVGRGAPLGAHSIPAPSDVAGLTVRPFVLSRHPTRADQERVAAARLLQAQDALRAAKRRYGFRPDSGHES